MTLRNLFDRRSLIETALAAAVLGGLVYCLWHAVQYKYLPQPFFHDPFDTYADWFNTAFWARNEGTYDTWQTIYPPLTFVLLRILGIDSCYPRGRAIDPSAGLAARDCDWIGLVSIYAFIIIIIVLIYHALRKIDQRTAIQRTICVGLGLPMVNSIERGNLAFVSFLFLILAFCPILKSARLRWIAAGIAVNFKLYLIGAIVALLLKRRWRWVECALISTVVIYLVSYALLGRGAPVEIIDNIRAFADIRAMQLLEVSYTTTYLILISLLEGDYFPGVMLFGSETVDRVLFILPMVQHAVQGMIVLAAAATWLRPEAVPSYRAVNLAILLALITTEAGGYSQMYFMMFVMMEPWKGFLRKLAIIGCYILAIPLDISLNEIPEIVLDTYLGNARTLVTYGVTVGPFIRPLIILTIAMAIAMLTICEVWLDVRRQGWSARWRFRRDPPLLPWVAQPQPPAAIT